jgi:hypothetical protein
MKFKTIFLMTISFLFAVMGICLPMQGEPSEMKKIKSEPACLNKKPKKEESLYKQVLKKQVLKRNFSTGCLDGKQLFDAETDKNILHVLIDDYFKTKKDSRDGFLVVLGQIQSISEKEELKSLQVLPKKNVPLVYAFKTYKDNKDIFELFEILVIGFGWTLDVCDSDGKTLLDLAQANYVDNLSSKNTSLYGKLYRFMRDHVNDRKIVNK